MRYDFDIDTDVSGFEFTDRIASNSCHIYQVLILKPNSWIALTFTDQFAFSQPSLCVRQRELRALLL